MYFNVQFQGLHIVIRLNLSTGVPVSPALTVLQELKSLDIGNDSFIDTDESEETVDSEEDGFTVGDPGDFLSSIRFRPVKFRYNLVYINT